MGAEQSTQAGAAPDGGDEASHVYPSALVITGPSGVGKGTLIRKLMQQGEHKYGFCCSHTTRQPRDGEVVRVAWCWLRSPAPPHPRQDGEHYFFVSKEQFEADIRDGKFLEQAQVHSNYYGTSIASVARVAESGRCCILDIDTQGARQVRTAGLRAIYVFVAPPSVEELETRLRGRGTESEEQVAKRLANAKAELDAYVVQVIVTQ